MNYKILIAFFGISLSLSQQAFQSAGANPVPSSPPPAESTQIGVDFSKIAVEGPSWTVYYGANNSWKSITGTGMSAMQCEPGTFGGDPAAGVAKKCFVSGKGRGVPACAADFGGCNHKTGGTFVYGVYGKQLVKKVTGAGNFACRPESFGSDPAPGIPKNCFFFPDLENTSDAPTTTATNPAPASVPALTPTPEPVTRSAPVPATDVPSSQPPAGSTQIGVDLSKIAVDGPSWTVYYGANNSWKSITGSGMSAMQCEPRTFGGDPAFGVAKKCFVSGKGRVVPACAADFGGCTYKTNGTFVYGVYGKQLVKKVTGAGNFPCRPESFGGDPAPRIPKNCFFFADLENTSNAPTTTATNPAPAPVPVPVSPPEPTPVQETSTNGTKLMPKDSVSCEASKPAPDPRRPLPPQLIQARMDGCMLAKAKLATSAPPPGSDAVLWCRWEGTLHNQGLPPMSQFLDRCVDAMRSPSIPAPSPIGSKIQPEICRENARKIGLTEKETPNYVNHCSMRALTQFDARVTPPGDNPALQCMNELKNYMNTRMGVAPHTVVGQLKTCWEGKTRKAADPPQTSPAAPGSP